MRPSSPPGAQSTRSVTDCTDLGRVGGIDASGGDARANSPITSVSGPPVHRVIGFPMQPIYQQLKAEGVLDPEAQRIQGPARKDMAASRSFYRSYKGDGRHRAGTPAGFTISVFLIAIIHCFHCLIFVLCWRKVKLS